MEKLNVLLIGSTSGNIDEGMKKITWNLYKEISKYHNTMVVTPLELLKNRNNIKAFKPDILHYVTGPSIYSFILLRYIKKFLGGVKTIVSVTHPNNLVSKKLISLFKPDLVLVQSNDMRKFFEDINIPTQYFPNGVDITKFKPVNEEERRKIKIKYGLNAEKFTLLHVGNLKRGRNIEFFKELSRDDEFQIMIVASTSIKAEKKIIKFLMSLPNIKLIDYYVDNIQDIYNASDLYVFPVTKRPYAVEIPLSILEAMACNVPIVTTKFAGLTTFFKEGDGLLFVENMKELFDSIYYVRDNKNRMKINTRNKVINYSWEKIGIQLNSIYYRLIE